MVDANQTLCALAACAILTFIPTLLPILLPFKTSKKIAVWIMPVACGALLGMCLFNLVPEMMEHIGHTTMDAMKAMDAKKAMKKVQEEVHDAFHKEAWKLSFCLSAGLLVAWVVETILHAAAPHFHHDHQEDEDCAHRCPKQECPSMDLGNDQKGQKSVERDEEDDAVHDHEAGKLHKHGHHGHHGHGHEKDTTAHFHQGHGHDHEEQASETLSFPTVALVTMAASCLHSLCDGCMIAGQFKIGYDQGWKITGVEFFHEVATAISCFAVYINAGLSKKTATFCLLGPNVFMFVGALMILYVFESLDTIYIASAACGMFFYVSLADILPEIMHTHASVKQRIYMALILVVTLASFLVFFLYCHPDHGECTNQDTQITGHTSHCCHHN